MAPAPARNAGRSHGPSTPSYTTWQPPRAYAPTAAPAAVVIVSFWACDSGSHGSMKPRDQKAKNASPGTSAAAGNASATRAATVDLPTPGGPVTTMGSLTSPER